MPDYVPLPLSSGGTVGVRPRDVALIQDADDGGSVLVLANQPHEGVRISVSADAAATVVGSTWFAAGHTRINPEHILRIVEEPANTLTYYLLAGVELVQEGVSIKTFNEVLAETRANRRRDGLES